MQDPYKILNILKSATTDQIKRAYKIKIKLAHPDKGGSEELAQQINWAYTVLMDSKERHKIDALLHLQHLSIDQMEPVTIAGSLPTAGVLKSHPLRNKHKQLILQYQEKPLNTSFIAEHLTPPKNRLDIFAKIKSKASFEQESQNFKYGQIITPSIVLEILYSFFSGKIYATDLQNTQHYVHLQVVRLNIYDDKNEFIPLYEAALEIISIETLDQSNSLGLVNFIEKMIQCCTKISDEKITEQLTLLLQHQSFRDFIKITLETCWRSNTKQIDTQILHLFDDRILLAKEFEQLKTQLNHLADPKELAMAQVKLRHLRLSHWFARDIYHDLDNKSGDIYPNKVFRVLDWIGKFVSIVNTDDKSGNIYRNKAFRILDWIGAFEGIVDKEILINLFLQAGLFFQKSAWSNAELPVRMADSHLAFNLYATIFHLANDTKPNIQLYAYTHALKYIAGLPFHEPNFIKLARAYQHRTLWLINFYPFFMSIQSSATIETRLTQLLTMMQLFLRKLVTLNEKRNEQVIPLGHDESAILYQAYEACLKNWYLPIHDVNVENGFKIALIQALLKQQGWPIELANCNVNYPWVMAARDRDGWLQPISAIPIPRHPVVDKFQALDGIEIDHKQGTINFLFKQWRPDDPDYSAVLTLPDMTEIFERNLQHAVFSLDPVDPDMPYHPFNKMLIQPTSIQNTQLKNTLLMTDYLLKFFTVGQEVQGRFPFAVRPLNTIVDRLPPHLKKIIDDFREATHIPAIHRFWIEAIEMPIIEDINGAIEDNKRRIGLGPMRMVVRKHMMTRDEQGNLIDTEEDDEGWDFYLVDQLQLHNYLSGIIKLPRPTIIKTTNIHDQRLYLLDHIDITEILIPPYYYDNFVELSKTIRSPEGRVKVTAENFIRLYRMTLDLTRRANKSHHFSPEYIFAAEFSTHYDAFARYFSEFGRLRELSRVLILTRFLNALRDATHKNLKGAQDHLNNEVHWTKRQQGIDHAITSVRQKGDQISKDINDTITKIRLEGKQTLEKCTTESTAEIRHCLQAWRKDIAPDVLYQKKLAKANDIKHQIKDWQVDSHSSEVNQICRDMLADAENEITSQHGYSAWNEVRYRIESEIDGERSKIAETITTRRKENYTQQLRGAYNNLQGHIASYELDRLIQDILHGNVEDIARAEANYLYNKFLGEIKSQNFPNASLADFKNAIEGNQAAIQHLIDYLVEQRYSSYRQSMNNEIRKLQEAITQQQHAATTEINRLKGIIPAEKQQIRDEIQKIEHLLAEFTHIHLATEEPEYDLSQDCLWIPANIRHDVGRGYSRFVYGGVKITPKVNSLTREDPLYRTILDSIFFDEHHVGVGTDYFRSVHQNTLRIIPTGENTNLLFYLNLMDALNDALHRAQEHDIDIDSAEAEARRRAEHDRQYGGRFFARRKSSSAAKAAASGNTKKKQAAADAAGGGDSGGSSGSGDEDDSRPNSPAESRASLFGRTKPGDHKYHKAPETLPGFPDFVKVRGKTPVQGGGGIRDRWRNKKGIILEWDFQHGTVEKYSKSGEHRGEFNSNTGKQLNPAIAGRNIKRYL